MSDVPIRLGRYQLRYRIAVGGMGGVYLARATGAGGADKVVAVKLLHEHLSADEAVVTMFLDEARIVSAINHVNVCSVFDFGEQEGLYYLVMEYLEGEPLDRVLKSLLAGVERHPLHPWLIARVVADAAEGLHAAHELANAEGTKLDVVHRDVSPHNLFVTYDGVTKVVDFGIARARERSTATEAGTFKGKFEYAAPEQIVGKQVDRRADVWALGVCLWELLSGARLFHRDDPSATGRAVLDAVIPPLTDVPPALEAIVRKALQRDPAKRFSTARELGRGLREALAASGAAVDPPLVGEWLEELFPGDRQKRQTLFVNVRRAGPDDRLEAVPEPLRIKGAGTGSQRDFRSGSGSGVRPAAPPPGVAEAPTSRSALLIAVLALLVLLTAGGAFVLLREDPPAAVLGEPLLPALDAGREPLVAGGGTIDAERQPGVVEEAADAGAVELVVAPVTERDAGAVTDAGSPALAARPTRPTHGVRGTRDAGGALVSAPAVDRRPVRSDGRVHFRTPGTVAEVLVDGKPVGATPLTIDLPAGAHTFELRARGFDFGGPQSLKVQLGGDYNVEIDTR